MGSRSSQSYHVVGCRAVGSTDPNTGAKFGGIYYPAHNKNGKTNPARWEGMIALNANDWVDANGNAHKGKQTYIRLIIWNSKNSQNGFGIADFAAKCISPGKELSFIGTLESFEKRLFDQGQPVILRNGDVATYQEKVVQYDRDLILSDDSTKLIGMEIANWKGEINFFSRPPQWNMPGTADANAWDQIKNWRKAHVWDKQSSAYGYARVIIPENAQLVDMNAATTGNAGAVYTGANGGGFVQQQQPQQQQVHTTGGTSGGFVQQQSQQENVASGTSGGFVQNQNSATPNMKPTEAANALTQPLASGGFMM